MHRNIHHQNVQSKALKIQINWNKKNTPTNVQIVQIWTKMAFGAWKSPPKNFYNKERNKNTKSHPSDRQAWDMQGESSDKQPWIQSLLLTPEDRTRALLQHTVNKSTALLPNMNCSELHLCPSPLNPHRDNTWTLHFNPQMSARSFL